MQWPWDTQWHKMGTDPVTGNDVYTAVARPSRSGAFFTHDRENWTKYWGLELNFHKRLANSWMANASFNYQDYNKHLNEAGAEPLQCTTTSTTAAADPASYRSGQIFFNSRWMVKANALYMLPWGFTVSGTMIANEGNPVYNGRNTLYGITLYPKDEEYGDVRQPNIVQVNLALEKRIDLGDNVSMTLEARLFNAFNNTTIIRVGQYQVPQTLTPDMITAPGIAQFGVRMSWR